jgi:hypothetical protein
MGNLALYSEMENKLKKKKKKKREKRKVREMGGLICNMGK